MRSQYHLAAWSIAAAFLAASACTAQAQAPRANTLDLTCTGDSYKPDGSPYGKIESVSLTVNDSKPSIAGLPGFKQPPKSVLLANNMIELKFETGGLTGEYYKFTGDLFLIHSDGKLTKLLCKPK